MKTTISSSNAHMPAPKWYRKMQRIIYLLSGPVVLALFEVFHASDAAIAQFSKIMAFLPTLLEVLNIALANGEQYQKVRKYTVGIVVVICCGLMLSSCGGLQKKITKATNLIQNNGGFVLKDKNDLPQKCAEAFPCVTTEKETSETTTTTTDNSNQVVKDSLKLVKEKLEELQKIIPNLTTLEECKKTVEQYQKGMRAAAGEVERLSDQIKNSTTTYTKRVEQLTKESTAKLAAAAVETDREKKKNDGLQVQLKNMSGLYDNEVKKREDAEDLAHDRLWLLIKAGIALVLISLLLFKLRVIKF
jgi:hypothetical protein